MTTSPDPATHEPTAPTPAMRRPASPPRSGGRWVPTLVLLALGTAAGCTTTPAPTTAPAPGPRPPSPELPPIPRADGPLDLRVSYPRDSASIATRGDNFIFGSTGNARTRLTIDGRGVEVQPNGGFLAFIPVPGDGVYRLRAELDGQVATLDVPVLLPEPAPVGADSPQIVPGSVYPAGGWVALPDERVEVGFRGSAGGLATLVLSDGSRIPLIEETASSGAGATAFEVSVPAPRDPAGAGAAMRPPFAHYRGFFTARRIVTADTTVAWPALTGEARPAPSLQLEEEERAREREAGVAGAPLGRPIAGAGEGAAGAAGAEGAGEGAVAQQPLSATTSAVIELTIDGRTVTRPLPLNLLLADPDRPRVGVAWDPNPPERNGDGAIIGRLGPGGGPYHYFWENGTELTLTGERNGIYRSALTDDLTAWSPAGDVRLRPAGTPPPASRVAVVRMDPQPGWIDVRVALDRRLPYRVEEGDRSLSLLVYGAISRANFMQHGRVDPQIERGEWAQPSDGLFRLDVHLATRPWGYETLWDGADLVLRIRRPPAIDRRAPLRGLTVGIDPGHGGADRFTMGPTGLTEADANLYISRRLAEALRRRGARVVMTRTTDATVSLVERTVLARQENVDLWISVHNNAFPDGVDPWENNGTSVYYNHPRAAALAWAVQEELLDELGLRDLGVGRADLHQARFAWAPAILTEIMFMMIPEQEAALRDEQVQRRIAEAHVRGLERWLRAWLREGTGTR